MKKVFKFMMMALVAIVMSAGFAACSSDDDDNNKTPETPQKTKVYYHQTIDITFSDDLQALYPMGIAIDICEGDSANGPGPSIGFNTAKHFEQDLSFMFIPTVYSYKVNFNLSYYDKEKIAALPEKESYDLTWTDNSIIQADTVGGGEWADTIQTTHGNANVKKSEIDSYIRENIYQKVFRVNIGEIIKKHEKK